MRNDGVGMMAVRRTLAMAAMFTIGDAVLGLVAPRRHVALWRSDVRVVDALVRPFAGHASRRRGYALVQIGAGLALAGAVLRR